jgi:methionine sulfoxide reductase heme-binding subunit
MNSANPSARRIRGIKITVFSLGLVPLAVLMARAGHGSLGANPIEFVQRDLGTWTLNFLLLTLAVTPLRRATGWHWLIRLRRMLGLFTFFYASLHLVNWLVLDQFFDWRSMALDIVKRPYITVGLSAFVLLIPLATTSTNAMVRRLGGRRWQNLHRMIYPIAVLCVVHYWWLVKKDVTWPLIYGLTLAVLLGLRVLWRDQERRRQIDVARSAMANATNVVRFVPRRE